MHHYIVVVEDILARQNNFEKHLRSCQHAPRWARPSMPDFREYVDADGAHNATSSPRQTAIPSYFTECCAPKDRAEFERLLVEYQADNQLPDLFITRPSTRRLLEFVNKHCIPPLPTRQILGGRILDTYSKEGIADEESSLKQTVDLTGGRVNFLSDVWMNISKTHLLGCQLSLHGNVCALGLYPTNHRHDGVAIAEQMEKIMLEVQAKGWVIGAVVTDDAGQCSRARRILALRWPRVVFVRCFAHAVNNLVKAVLNTAFRRVTAKASDVVKTLNASSSKWLSLVEKAMTQTYGTTRKLIPLCTTRWNSMQSCFASLLRVRTALSVFEVTNKNAHDFPDKLKILEDAAFWSELEKAEEVIRPLCYASFMLQSDNNTLADVVLCFRELYDKFVASSISVELVGLLEKRWNDCEQPLFLLAFVLHPGNRELMKELPGSVANMMGEFALAYYRKLFDRDARSIVGEMSEWMRGAYTPFSLANFENLATPPLAAFWQEAKSSKDRAHLGSELPELALVVLAMAVNTATCERYFSELALIHTARRNKMNSEKARKIAAIRRQVRDRDRREGGKEQAKKPKAPKRRITDPNELKKVMELFSPPRQRRGDEQLGLAIQRTPRHHPPVHRDLSSLFADSQSQSNHAADDLEAGSEEDEDDSEDDDDQDPLEHWDEVFQELVEDDRDQLQEQQPRNDAFTALGQPNNPPFPSNNDENFPQERTLPGIRSAKFTLSELFGVITT